MKNLISILLFTALTFQLTAQDSLSLYKPTEKMLGVSFATQPKITDLGLNSITDNFGNSGLLLRYYLKNDLAARIGVGATFNNFKDGNVDSVSTSLVEYDTVATRFDYFVSLGLEKHFKGTERLDPYAGVTLSYAKLGKQRAKSTTKVTDTTGTASGTSEFVIDGTFEGGGSFGVNPFIGFNYFLAKNICLGAEYSFGFNAMRRGGEEVLVVTDTPVNGTAQVTRIERVRQRNENAFMFKPQAAISFTYFF